jgi:hypothetical protein
VPPPTLTPASRFALRTATFASVVLLACCLWMVVPRLAMSPTAPGATCSLERLPRANVDDERGEVHLHQVLVDGLPTRVTELDRFGAWSDADAWHSTAQHSTDKADAVVGFRVDAASLTVGLMRHPRGARVRVAGPAGAVDVDSCGEPGLVWIDAPQSAPPGATALASIALLVILVGALRPWRGGSRATTWLALHLSLLHLLYWASQPIGGNGDTPGYFDSLALFVEHGRPSYYPPGYPLFLGLCSLLTENVGLLATLLQHLAMVASFLALFAMLRAELGVAPAFVIGLVGGSGWPALNAPQLAISESVTTAGMVLGVYFVWSGVRRDARWRSAVGGLCFGFAALARVVPLAACLPAAAAVCLLPWRRRRPVHFAVCVATTFAALLAAMGWTGWRSGSATLSDGTGAHLFNHFVTHQRLLNADGQHTRELLRASGLADLRGLPHWDVTALVQQRGGVSVDLRQRFTDVAWEAARMASIPQHLACIVDLAWRELHAEPSLSAAPWPCIDRREARIENRVPATPNSATLVMARRLLKLHQATWPIVTWLFVASWLVLPLLRPSTTWFAIVWSGVAYLLATACVEYFLERYNLAIYPFTVVAALGALAAIMSALAGRRIRLAVGGVANHS